MSRKVIDDAVRAIKTLRENAVRGYVSGGEARAGKNDFIVVNRSEHNDETIVTWIYHETPIVQVFSDHITVNSGGWQSYINKEGKTVASASTRARIDEALRVFCGRSLHQDKRVWYVGADTFVDGAEYGLLKELKI